MSVPTLTDAKAQLNITGSSQDELLNVYLTSALKMVEVRVGPSSVETFTEQVTAHSPAFNLSKRPVVSLTSLTPLLDGWVTHDVADLEFDERSGSVWRRDHGTLAGRWEVVYEAGWTTFPDNYHLATLITLQHLWKTQRGGSRRPDQATADEVPIRFGSSMTRALRRDSLTLPVAAEALISDGIYFGGIA
jgi:hypothetical protein